MTSEFINCMITECSSGTLNLSNMNIDDTGAKDLAEGLKDTQVHTLSLYRNNIGAIGAKDLAEGLKGTQVTDVIGVFLTPELTATLQANLQELSSLAGRFFQAQRSQQAPEDDSTPKPLI